MENLKTKVTLNIMRWMRQTEGGKKKKKENEQEKENEQGKENEQEKENEQKKRAEKRNGKEKTRKTNKMRKKRITKWKRSGQRSPQNNTKTKEIPVGENFQRKSNLYTFNS